MCHRVVSVMLDTIAISGHIQISARRSRPTSQRQPEHAVDTQGCSLIDLSAASCIDWYQTLSNDVNEVHAVLGTKPQ